jgi:hypothetical protein
MEFREGYITEGTHEAEYYCNNPRCKGNIPVSAVTTKTVLVVTEIPGSLQDAIARNMRDAAKKSFEESLGIPEECMGISERFTGELSGYPIIKLPENIT